MYPRDELGIPTRNAHESVMIVITQTANKSQIHLAHHIQYSTPEVLTVTYEPLAAALVVISISIDDVPIVGSPFEVIADAGPPDPSCCIAEGHGLQVVGAGDLGSFLILPRDRLGNRVDTSGLNFKVSCESQSRRPLAAVCGVRCLLCHCVFDGRGTGDCIQVTVTDFGHTSVQGLIVEDADGIYAAQYSVATAGRYFISVT